MQNESGGSEVTWCRLLSVKIISFAYCSSVSVAELVDELLVAACGLLDAVAIVQAGNDQTVYDSDSSSACK